MKGAAKREIEMNMDMYTGLHNLDPIRRPRTLISLYRHFYFTIQKEPTIRVMLGWTDSM